MQLIRRGVPLGLQRVAMLAQPEPGELKVGPREQHDGGGQPKRRYPS